jgi:hypothetical protein
MRRRWWLGLWAFPWALLLIAAGVGLLGLAARMAQ